MNKTIHGLIVAFLALSCLWLWGMLTLTLGTLQHMQIQAPAFTRLLIGLRPVFVVLPVAAAIYCVWVWFQKADRQRSWVPFFATAMTSLVVVMLPTLLAVWLPIINYMGMSVRH